MTFYKFYRYAYFNGFTGAKCLVRVLAFCLEEKITRRLPYVVERELHPSCGGQGFVLDSATGLLWTSDESLKLSVSGPFGKAFILDNL